MIVLLTLYPIVMLEQMFLNPLWDSLSLDMAEAIFIGNQLSVAATGFLLIPLAPPRLRVVATPEAQRFMGVEAAGIGLIVGLYALSIVVFAWLT
jgi:antibiotic biosynthesis monooxygenase (ABM) superfamily enzyme